MQVKNHMPSHGAIMPYGGRSVADGTAHCANGTVLTVHSASTLIFSNSQGPATKIPKLALKFPS